ncbi:MAG: hypothetical protein DRN06_05855 [Thermoprotei archaeon]|nr:MAG: hypothetical protein DRN06_05855 [Thermoprotei archaeon]
MERAVDITELLPRSFVGSLEYGYRNIRDVEDRSVRRIVFQNPPTMLMAEFMELNRRCMALRKAYSWTHPYPVRLLRTKDFLTRKRI